MNQILEMKEKSNTTPTIADRMDRLPSSRWAKVIVFATLLGWYAETIELAGTSFLLPTIRQYFGMDLAVGGYYSSICFVGMFIGAIFAGNLADKIGRVKVLLASMIIWGLSAFALVFSPNIEFLFIARFVLGIGLGAEFPVAISYLSEIVSSKDRPKYMTLFQMIIPIGFATAGVLTILILPHFDWRGVYLAQAIPALIGIAIRILCPESPLWLASKGKHAEAEKICVRFEEKAQNQYGTLPPAVPLERPRKNEEGGFKELFSRKYLKATILCFFIWFISMFSDYGLTTWLTTILLEKGFDVVTSTSYITIGILGGIPAWFFSTWAAKKYGRKKTFLIAGLCTSLFGIIYGGSVSIIMLVVFGILYQFGKYMNAMCLALYTPELYDTHVRAAGNGLGSSWGRMGSILGPILLAIIMTNFGIYATMYVAAGMVIIPGLLVFLFGPETKDKRF